MTRCTIWEIRTCWNWEQIDLKLKKDCRLSKLFTSNFVLKARLALKLKNWYIETPSLGLGTKEERPVGLESLEEEFN